MLPNSGAVSRGRASAGMSQSASGGTISTVVTSAGVNGGSGSSTGGTYGRNGSKTTHPNAASPATFTTDP
jgi:hypothetical protein